ncbi:MAG: hypothetical protein WDW38_000427 [Sanguina aurantia]
MAAVETMPTDSVADTDPCLTTSRLSADGTAPAQNDSSTVVEETLKTLQPIHDDSSHFECNVCLEVAQEPVVTLCGHLYCWPCLYRWMQVQRYSRVCPVCKAGVDVDKVVPIYGRGLDVHAAQDCQTAAKLEPCMPRPAGQQAPATPVVAPAAHQGMLQALFGFQFGPGQGYVDVLAQEQQHQAFLSRLLLMLGSFVIMCLLLF